MSTTRSQLTVGAPPAHSWLRTDRDVSILQSTYKGLKRLLPLTTAVSSFNRENGRESLVMSARNNHFILVLSIYIYRLYKKVIVLKTVM